MSTDEVSEYRRKYEEELAKAAEKQTSFGDLMKASRSRSSRRGMAATAPADRDEMDEALSVVKDPKAGDQLRTAALQTIGINIEEHPDAIDTLLEILRDGSLPTSHRLAVLNLMHQISFQLVRFPGKRPDFLETLRSIIDDPDPQFRRRVIGILAREKDAYVQSRLIEGLKDRSKALVPPAKAIQFLGYDVHAEHFPLLRGIVEHPPSRTAKKEALRLLAADPSSSDMLLEVLKDSREDPEVRRVSAIALQSAAPQKAQEEARRILMNDDEDDGLRASSLNTLTHFGNPTDLSSDADLQRQVDSLNRASKSRRLKQAAAEFISRSPT